MALTEAVARAVPGADLFATAGLAEPSYVDPTKGGIPAALDSRVTITAGMLGPQDYPPAGQRFLRAYARRYGYAPTPRDLRLRGDVTAARLDPRRDRQGRASGDALERARAAVRDP